MAAFVTTPPANLPSSRTDRPAVYSTVGPCFCTHRIRVSTNQTANRTPVKEAHPRHKHQRNPQGSVPNVLLVLRISCLIALVSAPTRTSSPALHTVRASLKLECIPRFVQYFATSSCDSFFSLRLVSFVFRFASVYSKRVTRDSSVRKTRGGSNKTCVTCKVFVSIPI